MITLFGAYKRDSLKVHLVRGVSGSFILLVNGTVLGMLISVILARLLGAKGFGTYSYAMAVLQVLVMLASFGLPSLIVREVAANRTRENWGLIQGLLRWASQTTILISIGLGLLAAAVAWIFKDHLGQYGLITFWIAIIALPLIAFIRLQAAALRGLRKIVIGQLPMRVIRPGLFLVLLGAAYLWLYRDFSASQAMGMQVVAFGVASVVGWVLLRKNLPNAVKTATPVFHIKGWMKSVWPFLFAAGMVIIYGKTDILMIGAMRSAEEVGIYRVAQRGAELVPLVLMAVEIAIAPTISKLYTEGKMQKLQRMVTISVRTAFILSFPVAFGLIIFGSRIVPFVFGVEFAPGAVPLAILCGVRLVASGTGSAGIILNMTGYERDTAKAIALSAILNVMLNVLFIPIWGIVGAAIATGISIVLCSFLMAVWVVRRIGIHATILGRFLG